MNITVTEAAKKKVLAVMEAEKQIGKVLRVRVDYTGGTQLLYDFKFEEQANKLITDTVIDAGEFKIYMDPLSMRYMDGGRIDYEEKLSGGAFKLTSPMIAPEVPPQLDSPQARTIQKLLDEQINPAVAEHGGFISLVDVKDNYVYVKMSGGCHGCGMASATLRQGVEYMIKEAVPTIEGIIDVTDHATGDHPFIPGAY